MNKGTMFRNLLTELRREMDVSCSTCEFFNDTNCSLHMRFMPASSWCHDWEPATEPEPEPEHVRVYNTDGEPEDLVLRTQSGRVLTEADILDLAGEAERGYTRCDCGDFTPNQDGRCESCRVVDELLYPDR